MWGLDDPEVLKRKSVDIPLHHLHPGVNLPVGVLHFCWSHYFSVLMDYSSTAPSCRFPSIFFSVCRCVVVMNTLVVSSSRRLLTCWQGGSLLRCSARSLCACCCGWYHTQISALWRFFYFITRGPCDIYDNLFFTYGFYLCDQMNTRPHLKTQMFLLVKTVVWAVIISTKSETVNFKQLHIRIHLRVLGLLWSIVLRNIKIL